MNIQEKFSSCELLTNLQNVGDFQYQKDLLVIIKDYLYFKLFILAS